MKNVRPGFVVALLCALFIGVQFWSNVALAQQIQTGTNNYITADIDNAGAAGLFTLVAPVTGKSVIVNSIAMTVVTGTGTGQTVQFGSCTATGCPGGFTAIAGALSGASSTTVGTNTIYNFAGNPLMVTNAGAGLFMRVTGTQPVGGWLTGLQQ